jgi:hypothetical protein
MRKAVLALASVTVIIPLFCQEVTGESKAIAVPSLPYLDWNACPFEGCTYREWTARKPIVVYDTWNKKRKPVGRLAAGDKVTGVTGVVITIRPGRIRMDRDLPQDGLRRGDAVLVYTNVGEGYAKVWFKGRFYPEFDITFARTDGPPCNESSCSGTYVDMGIKTWWAQVKLPSGRTGWVNMDKAAFDGVDQLACVPPLTAARAS